MKQIEFFFDISSAWTYLAFSQIEAVAERHQATLIWKPVLVGGVFNEVNQQLYETRATMGKSKAAYQIKDMQDWAKFYGLSINWPDVFPLNAVKLMRGAIIAQRQNKLVAYTRAGFAAYWGEGIDLSQMNLLLRLVEKIGMDRGLFTEHIETKPIKDALHINTRELIARGGFGSPTYFINETDMYFGNDRLALVECVLQKIDA